MIILAAIVTDVASDDDFRPRKVGEVGYLGPVLPPLAFTEGTGNQKGIEDAAR